MNKTKKIECKLSKQELEHLYYEKKLTQIELCEILGVKSYITVRRMLHEYGIDTNKNKMRSNTTKQGRNDKEFKKYLEDLYFNKEYSLNKIAKELNVSFKTINDYFKKYNIEKFSVKEAKTKFESGDKNPNWHGGRNIRSNGYIEIYMPAHPFCNKRGCVFEHRLVMEKHIGRYLRKDEIVHHIDFNPQNNDISNLKIMNSKEHKTLHNLLNPPRKKKEVV